jgi:serine O-acetyltransferase
MKPATECIDYRHHTWRGCRESLRADVVRYLHRSPESASGGDDFKHRLSAFCTPQLFSLAGYRISHFLWLREWRRIATVVARINQFFHRVAIHPASCIGPACLLPHPAGVTFYGTAGRELTLYSLAVCCPKAGEFSPAHGPKLGDRVTVGAHAVVLGDVRVGSDTKIPFSIVLQNDAPPGVIVVSKTLRMTARSTVVIPEAAPPLAVAES